MFDFALAERLGMTVADLRSRMSQPEWNAWRMYTQLGAQTAELQAKEAAAGIRWGGRG